MRRGMIPVYLVIFGGAAIGLFVGAVVVDAQPAALGWLFGTGAGIMVGAFIAAIATNEPLVGRGAMPSSRPRGPGAAATSYLDAGPHEHGLDDLDDPDEDDDGEQEEADARR